jgi:hypothetical protein
MASAVRLALEVDPLTDTFTNFPGLGVLLPATLRVGALGLILTPELVVSLWQPLHISGASQGEPGVEAWAYGRAGILLDYGTLVASASVALRTAPFSAGLTLAEQLPLKAAADVHWMVPQTLLYIGAAAQLELTNAADYFLEGGVSLGLLF